jgi:hypothetical protein
MKQTLFLLFLSAFIISGCSDVQFTETGSSYGKAEKVPVDEIFEGDVDDGDQDSGNEQVQVPINEDLVDQHRCGDSERKVRICHIPPGNFEARHTICIGLPALRAHTSHSNQKVMMEAMAGKSGRPRCATVSKSGELVHDYLGYCDNGK